jgi:hypothetical protein
MLTVVDDILVRPTQDKLRLVAYIQTQEFKDAWAGLAPGDLEELNTAANARNEEKGTIQVKSTPALANLDAAKTIEALSRTVSPHLDLACRASPDTSQMEELHVRTGVTSCRFFTRGSDTERFRPRIVNFGQLVGFFPQVLAQDANSLLWPMDGFCISGVTGEQ